MKVKNVLFICTHNSARSQIAEALLNSLKSTEYKAFSAGTVATVVNPFAIEALKKINIDISKNRSKSIDEFKNKQIDIVVTVCDNAKEECPLFISSLKAKYIHKSFKDPSNTSGTRTDKLNAFIKTRNKIEEWIKKEF